MKKLVIIDGKSVFYRGYYAMGALSLSDGTPTGGVYGFAVIAMELISQIKPDKVAVAWDKAKTSISKRKMIYNEYKAGRTRPPEDFFAQIPLLRELVSALGWDFLECDDYEADDIIGTLALQATHSASSEDALLTRTPPENPEYQVIIISSDLDMLQIVDKNVKMYRLLKGFSKLEEIDVAAVEEKYGIKKSQFLDLKALKGDASDNIPGVPGIGEKTAVKLLNEYGSVTGIYEHIDEISGAVHDKLVAGKESAEMSYRLGKIMTDAPVSLAKVPELEVDGSRILEALKFLEFNSLIRKYGKVLEASSSETPPSRPSSRGSVASGAVATAPDSEEGVSKTLPSDLIILPDVKAAMHEDPRIAERVLNGEKFWDLNQGAFLLNPLRRKDMPPEDYWTQKEKFAENSRLFKIFQEYDLPLIPVLYKMEKKGIAISREYFAGLAEEYGKEVAELEQKIYTLAGKEFNVNSPVQLAEVLFTDLGLSTKGIKKTRRGYSTGVKELLKLKNEHPVISKIMEYREAAKLLNTYISPLPELADMRGRIHTTFTQDVTSTGRLSSVNPNLQNIPVRTEEGKRIRAGFIAGEGRKFVSADYSQFELRLAAVLSGDKALISDFNSGVDIHTKTAADVFNVPFDQVTKAQRRAAKVINFGVLYGMSAKGLADAAGMSVPEAKKFIEDYFEVRKPIREYLNAILKQAREEGYVETYYGRRRPTPDVKSPNFMIRTAAERAAQNMPIQGTEADLMKKAMIKVSEILPEGASLVLQIHDSLIVECDEAQVSEVSEILKKTMEGIAPELAISLAVEVTSGENWGEL
ncbi:DNA polymerase I [Candidatus Saccharibacteria bacterium]|nr:DNA polymerase I [Candidatus Saccharibacteria bacterium]